MPFVAALVLYEVGSAIGLLASSQQHGQSSSIDSGQSSIAVHSVLEPVSD